MPPGKASTLPTDRLIMSETAQGKWSKSIIHTKFIWVIIKKWSNPENCKAKRKKKQNKKNKKKKKIAVQFFFFNEIVLLTIAFRI